MADENKLMVDAFAGVYLIQVNVDAWSWNHKQNGFDFEFIPVFFKLDPDGKPTGDFMDGSAWGANTPSEMAPVLDEFFHGTDN